MAEKIPTPGRFGDSLEDFRGIALPVISQSKLFMLKKFFYFSFHGPCNFEIGFFNRLCITLHWRA